MPVICCEFDVIGPLKGMLNVCVLQDVTLLTRGNLDDVHLNNGFRILYTFLLRTGIIFCDNGKGTDYTQL